MLNEILENDLRTLKETDFMGPTTRAEFNRRKRQAEGQSMEGQNTMESRKLSGNEGYYMQLSEKQEYYFSKLDEMLHEKRSERMKNEQGMFGL